MGAAASHTDAVGQNVMFQPSIFGTTRVALVLRITRTTLVPLNYQFRCDPQNLSRIQLRATFFTENNQGSSRDMQGSCGPQNKKGSLGPMFLGLGPWTTMKALQGLGARSTLLCASPMEAV